MDDRFRELRSLVERALDLPADERRAFIEEACRDDAALCAEGLDLLDGLRDDTFLTPAPSLRGPAAGADPVAGTSIGGYRLERVLGSGGMGTVYEAEQAAPRRRVALKVLGRSVRSGAARERFRYEAEVLGALRHRGIAQVYEAGIEPAAEGQAPMPWFAMELVVDASTLRAHADDARLSRSRRLTLFLDVLAAVQHGHQKGVIHRDLKPDNILVDRRGRVKVIDFGVARVADPEILAATLRTQAKEIVGTLAYMSPEQVLGKDVDTRSDVYALGVVLFELLVGTLPLDVRKTDFLTSARRIVEEPPRRPRNLGQDVPGDLEAILMKALEKEPAARYESAGALADDIRRYQAGEPVVARTIGALHQLRLFARRHKRLVTSAAIVLAVTIAAALVSLDFAFRSRESEQAAQNERVRFAQLYRTQFMQNVETVSVDASEIGDLYGGAPVALRMTRAAVGRLESLLASSDGDAEFRLRLADAYRRLASTLSGLSNSAQDVRPEIEAAGARALALLEDVLASDPSDAKAHGLRSALLSTLARVHASFGDRERARALIDEALAALEPAGAPVAAASLAHHTAALIAFHEQDYPRALDHLATRLEIDPGDAPAADVGPDLGKPNLAAAFQLRAEIQRSLRQFRAAEQDLRRCIALREELVERNPQRITYRLERARAWVAMGYVMMAIGEREGIESWYSRAHEELARLHEEAPRNLAVSRVHALAIRGLGQIENTRAIHDHPKGSAGRIAGLEKALAHYDRAIALLREVQARRPESEAVRVPLELTERMAAFTRRIVGGQGGSDPLHAK